VGLAEKNAEVYLEAYVTRELNNTESAKAGLEELRDTLGLKRPPARIECYDVSNTQGSEVVASMVVMVNGRPAPKEYRHFRIRSVSGLPDDFQSMREVLTRRLSRLGQGADTMGIPPDLVVVDGGAGQVSSAQEAFELAGVTFPLVGLAKANELVFIPGVSEPLELSRSSEALKLLQRIRDEAHRFALTYHRKLRGRKAVRSILEEVSGVGRERRKALLRHFGTLKRLREATIEELREVPTMTNAVAIRLYNYLRGGDSREEGAKRQ
jgi:excinuclease ABC subunit C